MYYSPPYHPPLSRADLLPPGNSYHRNQLSPEIFHSKGDESHRRRIHLACHQGNHIQHNHPFDVSLFEPCHSLVRMPIWLVCSHYLFALSIRFPPLPTPLLWAVRVWFSKKYAAAWEFGPCDINGKLKEHTD